MLSKRVVSVESKKIDGKANCEQQSIIGQPCLKCEEKCVGGYTPNLWRKICTICGCSGDCHLPLRMFNLPYGKETEPVSPEDKRHADLKYAWYPSGVDFSVVERYMLSLPKNCRPYKGSKAELYRYERLKYQHPLQDTSEDFCHELNELEKKRISRFGKKRIQECFGIGKVFVMTTVDEIHKCHGCSEPITPDSVIITANTWMKENNLWHPQCFRCNTCMELLVDLFYFYSEDKKEIYCGRHHGEIVLPRCNGCDELIFCGTYTEAKGKNWHKDHFRCCLCEVELHGKKYTEENDKLLCKDCFSKEVAHRCEKCNESIEIGKKTITIEGKVSFHDKCFVCVRCKQSLVGEKYYIANNKLFCSQCQSDHVTITQCQGCKNAISSTTTYIKHKKRGWHPECFKCIICQTWLASGEYHDVDGNPMCTDCYTTKVSRKCATCQEPIVKKGVQHGLALYHPECFNCSKCNNNMLNESKVKDFDGKPLCYNCSLKLAKKCSHCNGPITSRYTIYKGQPFHSECFRCNLCGSNIEGSEFYETSLNEILCTKCAKIH